MCTQRRCANSARGRGTGQQWREYSLAFRLCAGRGWIQGSAQKGAEFGWVGVRVLEGSTS